ncbi:hypothetical protein [Streptomyces fumanus]|uniref:Uncharacterized protein n=1 Tax=Streptomyces fumanus TaxID=67302 RepID=A0A919DY97_9ACTN|nr:hypothetical protein [Streptomyces fumanus]GHE91008.1 hypothetical protein GCM10018772_13680 [Streptomyces fumanus]
MQWTAIAATAVGAVIGIASTLTADHLRWRRDLSERDRDAMRSSYAQYVDALTQARDEITQTSRDPGLTAEERADNVRTVIGRHGVYAKQHQLELMAPVKVVRLAISAANELAGYRDSVINGFTREDPECVEARRAYREARYRLIDAMRFSLERH